MKPGCIHTEKVSISVNSREKKSFIHVINIKTDGCAQFFLSNMKSCPVRKNRKQHKPLS